MLDARSNEILKEYFLNKPVKKVQVFGSYARNEENQTSDIDLVLTMVHPVGLISLAGYKLNLEILLQKKLDLSTDRSLSPDFRNIIQQDLTTVYERN